MDGIERRPVGKITWGPSLYSNNELFDDDGILSTEGHFAPKNVRAVNVNQAMVVDSQGKVQGPFTYLEWLAYSHELWAKVDEVLHNLDQLNLCVSLIRQVSC